MFNKTISYIAEQYNINLTDIKNVEIILYNLCLKQSLYYLEAALDG